MKPIAVIYGTEEYLMEQARRRFVADCQQRSGGDAAVRQFKKDAPAAAVVEAFEGTSLFGGGSVVVWTECPFLPIKRGGRSRSKLTKEEMWFLEKLRTLSDENGVLFYTKGNIDTGCAFFKELRPMADVVAGEAVTEKNVMPYVCDFLEGRGKKLTLRAEQYLRGLFQTWDEISLLYVFSELEKLCISLDDSRRSVDEADVADLFAGTMEKNLFTFMDYFLRRDGRHVVPFLEGLFSRQDLFLKNVGYMMSRLRLLLAYKELKEAGMGQRQCESIMTQINKGRSVKYVLYHLQKAAPYWTIRELQELITNIFTLQRNIRRGTAAIDDIGPLICLYCRTKGRV